MFDKCINNYVRDVQTFETVCQYVMAPLDVAEVVEGSHVKYTETNVM